MKTKDQETKLVLATGKGTEVHAITSALIDAFNRCSANVRPTPASILIGVTSFYAHAISHLIRAGVGHTGTDPEILIASALDTLEGSLRERLSDLPRKERQ